MIARNGFGNVFQRKPPTKFKLVLIYRQTDAFISSNSSGSVLSEKGGKTATKKCEKSSDIFTDNENKFSGGNLILTKAEMLGLWYVDFFATEFEQYACELEKGEMMPETQIGIRGVWKCKRTHIHKNVA